MGLTLHVNVDEDGNCYGYELCVWKGGFKASTYLDVGPEEITKFAGCIAGFPAKPGDERSFVFGERGPAYPHGYCSLRFRSIASSVEAVLDVALEANQPDLSTAKAKAEFSIFVELDDITRFVAAVEEGLVYRAGWW